MSVSKLCQNHRCSLTKILFSALKKTLATIKVQSIAIGSFYATLQIKRNISQFVNPIENPKCFWYTCRSIVLCCVGHIRNILSVGIMWFIAVFASIFLNSIISLCLPAQYFFFLQLFTLYILSNRERCVYFFPSIINGHLYVELIKSLLNCIFGWKFNKKKPAASITVGIL